MVLLDAGEGGARRGGGDQSPVVRVLRRQEATAVLSEVIHRIGLNQDACIKLNWLNQIK